MKHVYLKYGYISLHLEFLMHILNLNNSYKVYDISFNILIGLKIKIYLVVL
jgi:hypothetical protein